MFTIRFFSYFWKLLVSIIDVAETFTTLCKTHTAYFVLIFYSQSLLFLHLLQCLTIWDFHVVQRAWLVPILISWVMKMLLIIHQALWSMPSHYARFWSLKALALKLTSETPVISEDNVTRGHVTEKCVVTQVLPCRQVVNEQSAKH